jgi:hypothetical protein
MKSAAWMQKVGLSSSHLRGEKIVVKSGETAWLSSIEGTKSVAPVTVRTVNSPEELRDLLVTTQHAAPMMPDGVEGCHVDNVSGVAADQLRSDRTEAVTFIYGVGNAMSPEARDAIVKRYFPLQVSLAALQDIEINTGSSFVIDSGVGSYYFGTVKIHQGGAFVVYSNASIVIDNLQKLPPN